MTTYRACSGQSRGPRQWGVCLTSNRPAWWRAQTHDGRVRLFATYEAAQRYADKLNAAEDPLSVY